MTRASGPWLLLALAVLGAGCAAARPEVPVVPATSLVAEAPAPAAAPEAPPAAPPPAAAPEIRPPAQPSPEPPPVLHPVTENQTFLTVEGVPRYKIGPGDVLEILLATGLTQERQTAVVRANGTVSAAFLEVKVAGLTTDQAAHEIRRRLEQFYRQLGVEVLVKEYASKKVTVLGAVAGRAGTLPLKGKMTLLDLLAEVGGVAANADLERVRIIRPDGPPITLSLLRLLDQPAAQAFVLDAGDVVFIPVQGAPQGAPLGAPPVPGAAVAADRVFVLGEVKTPGAFPLVPNMRLSHALALAGGPTDVAILESARIIRGGLEKPQIVEADFRKLVEEGDPRQDVSLLPSDLIVLPRSGIGNWNAFIAKLKPTLEILTFPLALPVQIRAISR